MPKKKMSKEERETLAKEKAVQKIMVEQKKEFDIGQPNKATIDEQFERLMIRTTNDQFSEMVRVLWNSFDRVFDAKEHITNCVVLNLEELQNMRHRNTGAFTEVVDNQIENMSITFRRFQDDYTKKSSLLVKRYDDLKTNIRIDKEDEERHLDLLIYEVHAQAQKQMWRFKGVSMVEQDEERQRLAEAMEEMTLQKYNTFSMVWKDVKKVFENWKSAVAHRKKTNRLYNKDDKMRKLILSQKIETVQKERIIRKLRKRLSKTELTNITTNTGIEVAQYRRDFKKLKKDVQTEKLKDDKDLSHLVAQSYAVEKRLLEIREKADKILRLFSLCKPFETKKEKEYFPGESPLALDDLPNSGELMKFWTKVSHIDAIRYKLKEEKQRLQKDNYLMKNFIRSKFIGKYKHFNPVKSIEM